MNATLLPFLEAGLGFVVAWDKPGGFIGREALSDVRLGGYTVPRGAVVMMSVVLVARAPAAASTRPSTQVELAPPD